jgi:hypothetical protein
MGMHIAYVAITVVVALANGYELYPFVRPALVNGRITQIDALVAPERLGQLTPRHPVSAS